MLLLLLLLLLQIAIMLPLLLITRCRQLLIATLLLTLHPFP